MQTNSLFMQAFQGQTNRIPVWLMRQAGRYLPQYQGIRKDHSLEDMFRKSDIIAEVTCQPIDIIGVDAAILFADILTPASHMGFDIRFDKTRGPIIANPIDSPQNINAIHSFSGADYQKEAIKQIKSRLGDIPLIGFAGGPFTVLTYLIEGGSTLHFRKTFRFMQEHPKNFYQLMEILTANSISYLKDQIHAGADVIQIFDSWAGQLPTDLYQKINLPFIQQIFDSLDVPHIYYLKNCAHLMKDMEQCGADFLSVDETVEFATNPILKKTDKGIQGNLYNCLLYADDKTLMKAIKKNITDASQFSKYIFNLSHGIFPDVSWEKVKLLVDTVHQQPRGDRS